MCGARAVRAGRRRDRGAPRCPRGLTDAIDADQTRLDPTLGARSARDPRSIEHGRRARGRGHARAAAPAATVVFTVISGRAGGLDRHLRSKPRTSCVDGAAWSASVRAATNACTAPGGRRSARRASSGRRSRLSLATALGNSYQPSRSRRVTGSTIVTRLTRLDHASAIVRRGRCRGHDQTQVGKRAVVTAAAGYRFVAAWGPERPTRRETLEPPGRSSSQVAAPWPAAGDLVERSPLRLRVVERLQAWEEWGPTTRRSMMRSRSARLRSRCSGHVTSPTIATRGLIFLREARSAAALRAPQHRSDLRASRRRRCLLRHGAGRGRRNPTPSELDVRDASWSPKPCSGRDRSRLPWRMRTRTGSSIAISKPTT